MKNVTITLDERVARWARLKAAELNTSVSRLVGEMLHESMRRERAYDAARRAWLDAPVTPVGAAGRAYPRREELHERAGLR